MTAYTNRFDAADAITAAGFTHLRDLHPDPELPPEDHLTTIVEYVEFNTLPVDPVQAPSGTWTRDGLEKALGGDPSRALYELRGAALYCAGERLFDLDAR